MADSIVACVQPLQRPCFPFHLFIFFLSRIQVILHLYLPLWSVITALSVKTRQSSPHLSDLCNNPLPNSFPKQPEEACFALSAFADSGSHHQGWAEGCGVGGQSIRSSIHGSAQAQMVIQINKFSILEAETLCWESHTYENMWSGGERAHGALISSSHVHHMNSCRNNKASMLLQRVFVLSCGLPNCAKLCVVQL